jgi:energy-coupling factor transporter ATP-binding protein EcfA2
MKIARLKIKDFLGIKEAEISPGKITVLAGKNRQGKSSILKAIEAAFKGCTPAAIHQGTERAEIVVDLEDILVTRVQTHKTHSVTVKTKDGFTRNAPQKFLDGLLGNFAFNPLAFLLSEAKARKDYLLKAMDVTVTDEQIREAAGDGTHVPVPPSGPALEQYAEAHGWFYRQRTEVNRALKAKLAAAGEAKKKIPEGYAYDPNVLVEIDRLTDHGQELVRSIALLEQEKKAADAADKTRARIGEEQEELAVAYSGKLQAATAIAYADRDVETANAKVAQLEAELNAARKNRDHIAGEVARKRSLEMEADGLDRRMKKNLQILDELPTPFEAEKLVREHTRLDEARGKMAGLKEHQRHMTAYEEAITLAEDAGRLADQAKGLDALVEKFGKELPAKALAEAKLPIEGLQIGEAGILVSGVPIDQLSASEQIEVTLSIARALSRELPLICIDGVERLDEETFAEFVKQSGSDGFQYFVTRVGAPHEGELEVRDGKVVAG